MRARAHIERMKWIVATNLRDDCLGALEFAAWLGEHAHEPGANPATALAVLRDRAGMFAGPDPADMLGRVEQATQAFVERSPASAAIGGVRAELSTDVARTLSQTAGHEGATLLLGRKAPRENRSLVRLGRIARRTLRQLHSPTVVVPTDWTAATAGVGPVMVAVDATEASLAALSFGEALATSVGRPLLAVQALQGPGGLGWATLPDADYVALRERYRREEADKLVSFLAEHGRASLTPRSEVGATVPALLEVADDVQAAMIVCGSRRLSRTERIFTASVGGELASFAPVPVAVVPPDFGPAQ